VRPYVRAVVLALIVTFGAMVIDPVHRGTAARVGVTAVVAIALVAMVSVSARRLPPAETTPFDPSPLRTRPPAVPADLARLAADLALYQHDGGPRLGAGAADRTVRAIARAGLERRFGTVVGDDGLSDAGLLARLGPATGAALARRTAQAPGSVDPVALAAELETLLDGERQSR
jgi:hypothetical protein